MQTTNPFQSNEDQKKAAANANFFESLTEYKASFEEHKDGSITFYPSPHLSKASDINTKLLATKKFLTSQKLQDIKKKVKFGELEAIHDFDAEIIEDRQTNICSFITGAVQAFNGHYPFKISPNNVFLLILQAVAVHVDKNAEKLRDQYVSHDGKMTLTVERDSRWFILREQKRDNDWNGVIQEFVAQIDKNTVAETTKLMEADFSDSSIIDVIANKICVMDVCKNYFEYVFMCVPGCGFPKMTLSGTKQDWLKLREKVDAILSHKVDKKWGANWKKAVLPMLDKFIDAYDGKIDCLFWNSMIKSGVTTTKLASSGGPRYKRKYWFNGWFNILFPFVCENDGEFIDNRFCVAYSEKADYAKGGPNDTGTTGQDIKCYPMGLSSAPVKTKYIDAKTGQEYNYAMKFLSGIIGYTQCPQTAEISCTTGWIITYDDEK